MTKDETMYTLSPMHTEFMVFPLIYYTIINESLDVLLSANLDND